MKALRLGGAFLLGVAACSLILAPVLLPVRTYEAYCGLRYGGAIPGAHGLLLTISEAPAELRGPGDGPWVLCTLTNTGAQPLSLAYPEQPGQELAFQSEGPAQPAPWEEITETVPVHVSTLPPGARIAFPCDLSRWLVLEPGRHSLRAERLAYGLRGGLPSRSNRLTLTVP